MEPWLKASGASGLDDVELSNFPSVGRGIKTLRHFKEGEKILTIPCSTLWTVKHAYADSLLGPALRSVRPSLSVEDTLAMFILFVRSRESEYRGLHSHVAELPKRYSSSIFFTDEELDVCAGSSLFTITEQLKIQIEDDYRGLVMRLLGQYRDLFPLEKFSIEDYKWALCTVWSRAMDFKLASGSSIRLMAPFADMLNHSSEVKQCHIYDPSTGDLSILAGKDYEAGEQIFIYYGPIPNNRLLRLYGFVLPGNSNDSFDLVLSTHPSAPHFTRKCKLWALAGLDPVSTISLTLSDPLPKSVLRYLRIQRLNETELALVALQGKDAATEKISDSNESEILQFLIESIFVHLEGFAIQAEELEEQLANGVYPSGGNAWAAAQVSLGEQKVLRLAKKSAEKSLLVVQSGSLRREVSSATAQCANCGEVSDHLMLCARCKAVMYCGRECQVAHFKVHKATCRAEIQGKETD